MNLGQQFQTLGRKQLAIQEGIDLMMQCQSELARNRTSADAWGAAAIMANVALIPLNVIVNAFELKAATSLYQAVVRAAYDKFSRSGTRIDNQGKMVLALLKQAVAQELKRKGLTQFIPGVNILVGLAEDSWAAMEVSLTVKAGSSEMSAIAAGVQRKITGAHQQLMQLGVRRAEILAQMQTYARTA
jgi:hypothetical protein